MDNLLKEQKLKLNKKTKERKQLSEYGRFERYCATYNQNSIDLTFRINDKQLNKQTFSEVALLNFVAKSYAESSLTLLKYVNEYKFEDSYFIKNNRSARYLPAMFCFRHYIELKLKCIYMTLTGTQFNTNEHSLSKLLEEIKEAGFELNVFNEPISFIENIENDDTSYFRYLISSKFDCVDKLNIPMFQFDKIKNYILEIEFCCSMFLGNKMLKNRYKENNK